MVLIILGLIGIAVSGLIQLYVKYYSLPKAMRQAKKVLWEETTPDLLN